mmetsp:Transcript_7146/g.15488  ORF Transcript_7146/g.15488 Transcript_7146/m.15488 type:complete len:224 (+) Transcript_7146:1911-2582(+)
MAGDRVREDTSEVNLLTTGTDDDDDDDRVAAAVVCCLFFSGGVLFDEAFVAATAAARSFLKASNLSFAVPAVDDGGVPLPDGVDCLLDCEMVLRSDPFGEASPCRCLAGEGDGRPPLRRCIILRAASCLALLLQAPPLPSPSLDDDGFSRLPLAGNNNVPPPVEEDTGCLGSRGGDVVSFFLAYVLPIVIVPPPAAAGDSALNTMGDRGSKLRRCSRVGGLVL